MPEDIINSRLAQLEDPDNLPICQAVLGHIDPESLSPQQQEKVKEVRSWHAQGVQVRWEQQIQARRQEQETEMGKKLLEMRRRGQITDEVLILYGISGPIPVRHPTRNREYTAEEKLSELRARMSRRFGVQWRERINAPRWLTGISESGDWSKQGF